MKKKTAIAFVLAAVCIVAFTCLVLRHRTTGETMTPARPAENGDAAQGRIVEGTPVATENESATNRVQRRMRPRIETEDRTDLTPEDKKCLLDIENAVDREDFDALLKILSTAANSTNAEIRSEIVASLGWFGERALLELTPFMADPDEDVAETARTAWELAHSEIASPKEKLGIARMILSTSASADSLRMIGGEYSNAASEYIDAVDDEAKATARRVETLQPIIDIMDGARKENVEACKEIYEDITGHEWISFEEANLYVSDPENYAPPDEREESAYSARSNSRRRSGKSAGSGYSEDSGTVEADDSSVTDFDFEPDDETAADMEEGNDAFEDDSEDFNREEQAEGFDDRAEEVEPDGSDEAIHPPPSSPLLREA